MVEGSMSEAPASTEPSPSTNSLKKPDAIHAGGRFKLRGQTDDLPQQWWFASTAIPLLAAAIGPLANVLSIAALVSKWKVMLPNNGQLPEGADVAGRAIADPEWVTVLNAISLAVGVLGNLALLFNFTRRIRYIIALPLTIIAWYIAMGILIGLVAATHIYTPPIRPGQTYSQGFWYAVIAACLYMFGSMILMINMLGYFLGHYAQHFELDDDQRTLILQTMMFFLWLAGGAAVFSKVCNWSYADALYFCDVTILTVGYGDFVAENNVGRGLVLLYSIFGIIFLGLMIKSIRQFAVGLSKDNIIRKHEIKSLERAVNHSVTTEKELRARLGLPPPSDSGTRRSSFLPRQSSTMYVATPRRSLEQYGYFDVRRHAITFRDTRARGPMSRMGIGMAHNLNRSPNDSNEQPNSRKRLLAGRSRRRERLLLLKEDRDRFNAMRDIQASTHKFKQYYALSISLFAYGILWCFGALVFMYTERRIQSLTYFEALYFCYVSLLTIGYGHFSPRSNAGKPFFVVWSLIAVPTMTFLVSGMGDTLVLAINRGTFTLADWTVLPKKGVLHDFVVAHPRLKAWLERRNKRLKATKRLEEGFTIQNPDELNSPSGTLGDALENSRRASPRLEQPVEEHPTEHDLARKLAVAIKATANDLRLPHQKKYSYEEWVEFTRLIRFSSESSQQVEEDEEDGKDGKDEGLVEWDWIGANSPMLADVSESEWILDRLCESLNRYTRGQARRAKHHQPHLDNNPRDQHSSPVEGSSPRGTGGEHSNPVNHHYALVPTYPAHSGPRSPTSKPTSPSNTNTSTHCDEGVETKVDP